MNNITFLVFSKKHYFINTHLELEISDQHVHNISLVNRLILCKINLEGYFS